MNSPGPDTDRTLFQIRCTMPITNSYREDAVGGEWKTLIPDVALDERVMWISGDERVEKACEMLVSGGVDVSCLLVTEARAGGKQHEECLGLFDFADVNVFILLAIGAYVPLAEELAQGSQHSSQLNTVINAVRGGTDVFVKDASNLSEKNDLLLLEEDEATVLLLLQIFSQGRHRVVIRNKDGSVKGVLSDRRFVRWLADDENKFPDVVSTLALPLCDLEIGVSKPVVSLACEATVLDAMQLMSDESVSSVAVVDASRALLSAVSVTDVGKLVATSEDRAVLALPLHQFISMIKYPQGSTDGEDLHPVFSVTPLSSFKHTIDLLLATNAHRAFITSTPSSSPTRTRSTHSLSSQLSVESSPNSPTQSGFVPTSRPTPTLYGVVSVVDILSVIARIAGLVGIDPNAAREQRRHRRGSSVNSIGAYGGSPGSLSPIPFRARSTSVSSDPKSGVRARQT